MSKPISQRDARRLRERVRVLEDCIYKMRANWVRDYPDGTHLHTIASTAETISVLRTARRLQHAVVAVESGDEIRFYGLPVAKP